VTSIFQEVTETVTELENPTSIIHVPNVPVIEPGGGGRLGGLGMGMNIGLGGVHSRRYGTRWIKNPVPETLVIKMPNLANIKMPKIKKII
jgi:hypothetical protein